MYKFTLEIKVDYALVNIIFLQKTRFFTKIKRDTLDND